jgi:hypothetical protein
VLVVLVPNPATALVLVVVLDIVGDKIIIRRAVVRCDSVVVVVVVAESDDHWFRWLSVAPIQFN